MSSYSDYANAVSRIYEAKGNAIAQGQAQSGKIWGEAIGHIGDLIGNLPGQIAQAKAADTTQQIRQYELAQAKDVKFQQTRANQIVAQLPKHPDGTYDLPAMTQQFAAHDMPADVQERALKTYEGVNGIITSFNQSRAKHGADLASFVLENHRPGEPVTADSVHLSMAAAQQAGIASEADVAKFEQLMAQPNVTPELVLKAVKRAGAGPGKYAPLPANSPGVLNEQNGQITPTGVAPRITNESELLLAAGDPKHPLYEQAKAALALKQTEKPAKTASVGSFEDYVTRTYGENPTPAQVLAARKAYGQADDHATGFAASDVTKLSPAGLDMAALNYRKTGVMPPLGMGDKSNRQAIINRAAALSPSDITRIEAGGTDLAGNSADYKADAASLKALKASRDAISAFENTALKNIDIFLNTAGKVVDSGSPLINTPARVLSGKVLGSPDQAAYDAARQVALNEIAKITSNPNLSGQLSDSARKEVEAFNPSNATLKQSVAVMRILKQDMANRATSYDQQIAEIKGRISGKKPDTPAGNTGGGGEWIDLGNGLKVRKK